MKKQLKISKKMASLIAVYTEEAPKPEAAVSLMQKLTLAAGSADKAGAVIILADEAECAYLMAKAITRFPVLDSALASATTDEERKPHFGEHSAWRALVKQIEPPAA